jgi:hypothetical protein
LRVLRRGAMTEDDRIPLAEVMERLRAELKTARDVSQDDLLKFEVGPIELDFEIGVTKEGSGGAGVRFWVLSLGAKGSYEKLRTQHLKLTLIPKDLASPDKNLYAAAEDVEPDDANGSL